MATRNALTVSSLIWTIRRGSLIDVQKVCHENPRLINSSDHLDRRPIHEAVKGRNREVLMVLIEAGADLEKHAEMESGVEITPLERAVIEINETAVSLLLQSGAEPRYDKTRIDRASRMLCSHRPEQGKLMAQIDSASRNTNKEERRRMRQAARQRGKDKQRQIEQIREDIKEKRKKLREDRNLKEAEGQKKLMEARREHLRKDCPICCEVYDMEKCFAVPCFACGYTACSTCVKHYITDTAFEASCLNSECRKVIRRETLMSWFGVEFLREDFEEQRKKVLFVQQKDLLPQTQPLAEATRALEKQLLRVEDITKEYRSLTGKELFTESKSVEGAESLAKALDDLDRPEPNFTGMKSQLRAIRTYTKRSKWILRGDRMRGVSKNVTRLKQMKEHCPYQDCRGYFGESGFCTLCQRHSCPDCRAPLGVEGVEAVGHACNPCDKESVQMIRKSTKQCPKCCTRIEKIDGCSQMWCTTCNSAFDWQTGEPINGPIHNPHYFEWLSSQHGGQAYLHENRHYGLGGALNNAPAHLRGFLLEALRIRNEIADDQTIIHTDRPRRDRDYYRRHRIWYLLGKYTEDEYRDALVKLEDAMMLSGEALEISATLRDGIDDTLRILLAGPVTDTKTAELLCNLDALRFYVNDCWKNAAICYGKGTTYRVTKAWKLIRSKLAKSLVEGGADKKRKREGEEEEKEEGNWKKRLRRPKGESSSAATAGAVSPYEADSTDEDENGHDPIFTNPTLPCVTFPDVDWLDESSEEESSEGEVYPDTDYDDEDDGEDDDSDTEF